MTPAITTPLLEPAHLSTHPGVQAYIITRNPNHWFMTDIPAHSLLIQQPGFAGTLPTAWSIYKPVPPSPDDGRREWWTPWRGAMKELVDDLAALDRLERSEDYMRARHVLESDDYYVRLFMFERNWPAFGCVRGDVIALGHRTWDPRPVRGRTRQLALKDVAALRELYDRQDTSLTCVRWSSFKRFFPSFNSWGTRRRDGLLNVHVIKPIRTVVGEPIRASSDEGAIWELLRDAGCAMPTSGV